MIIETHPPIFDVPADSAGRKEWIMSKFTKWLLISVASVALGWAALTTLYTRSVSEELTALRRENRNDVVYLRCRIRELEAELAASRLDRLDPPDESEDDGAASQSPAETVAPETDAATNTPPEDTATDSSEDTADTAVIAPEVSATMTLLPRRRSSRIS